MLITKIALTALTFVVLGLMLWDQLRLKGMTPMKWCVLAALLAMFLPYIWLVQPEGGE